MNRIGILALAAASALAAEEYPDFAAGMKTLGAVSGELHKAEKKTGPQVVRQAERAGSVYEEMIGFWRQRNAANAIKFSEEGKAAAVQLASAANAGDAERAEAAAKALGATCQGCHEAYREKLPDGRYAFKRPQQRQ